MTEFDLRDRLICKIGQLHSIEMQKLAIFILGLEAGQKIISLADSTARQPDQPQRQHEDQPSRAAV